MVVSIVEESSGWDNEHRSLLLSLTDVARETRSFNGPILMKEQKKDWVWRMNAFEEIFIRMESSNNNKS